MRDFRYLNEYRKRLENKNPDRGRKLPAFFFISYHLSTLENKNPDRGRKPNGQYGEDFKYVIIRK